MTELAYEVFDYIINIEVSNEVIEQQPKWGNNMLNTGKGKTAACDTQVKAVVDVIIT